MANYLPVSINIENRPILIFGGGSKAYEQIDMLLAYGADLTVAAEKVTPTIKELGKSKKISIVKSNGSNAKSLISRLQPVFVILADVEPETVAAVFHVCRKYGVDVHTVDYKDFCTFTFPAIIQRENISVAVSAYGASADAVKWVKERIEKVLPVAVDGMMGYFGALRRKLSEKSENIKSKKFIAMYREFLDTAMRENRILTAGEMTQIMAKYIDEAE